MSRVSITLAAALIAAPAAAEVVQSTPAGFEVRESVDVPVPAERVWPVVLAPRLWWNKDHTYSEDSANLSLDERAGGCFCEKLPNKGSVEHMRVVYIQPPKMVRMTGALGPLQAEAANGTLTIALAKTEAGTRITMSYLAGGYVRVGMDKLAPVFDRVLGLQMQGLKAAVESAPAPAARPGAAKPAPAPKIEPQPLAGIEQTISGLSDTAKEPPPK